MAEYDLAIIGAGMAGASLAAECASQKAGLGRVLLLEAEDQPGYHTTGRSAAFWEECYGGPQIVPLTLASGAYLREHGFLTARGALYVGRAEDAPTLDAFVERFAPMGVILHRIARQELLGKVPGLREQWSEGIFQPRCSDIDVAGLHQHYLTGARSGGVELARGARVSRIDRLGSAWRISAEDGRDWRAKTVVNAAGAWADAVAEIAGAAPLGIQPLRRTVVQVATDPAPEADQPLVLNINGQFYFKPESGRVWLSPHDEVPSPPCDAVPEEMDVATAIDQFENAVDWRISKVERKWAGLRSFAPDRVPVYGWDKRVPGFFWFAGQGGFGIQTAPAAARFGAQLLAGAPRDALTCKLDQKLYDPARFG